MNKKLSDSVFDEQGYRFNVGIVIVNAHNQVFWGKRRGQQSWQFPQGGLNAGESGEEAMWRELYEETGLTADDVALLGSTSSWLKYRLPLRFRRRKRAGIVQCIGQTQKWYLLRLTADDSRIDLRAAGAPEFDHWQWAAYWDAADEVVHFKRNVYQQALQELAQFLPDLPARQVEKQRYSADDTPHKPRRKVPSFAKKHRS